MKLTYLFFSLSIFIYYSCTTDVGKSENSTSVQTKVNYGHNIIVLVDFSNRIKDTKPVADSQIIGVIMSRLKSLFQSSIDKGIYDKLIITSVNTNDLMRCNISSSDLAIDLTKFKTSTERSDYLYHNTGINSFSHDSLKIISSFSNLSQCLTSYDRQLPADICYSFQELLTSPMIDTSSREYVYEEINFVNKYKNYVILITDGYIEAGRYSDDPDMVKNNKYRFLSRALIDKFRDDFHSSGKNDFEKFFKDNDYGIIPIKNEYLQDCKFLALEFFDRSLINGRSSKNPTDIEIMKLFWNDWLVQSGIDKSSVNLKSTATNTQQLSSIIDDFFK